MIEVGDPCILNDASGLEDEGLTGGMLGWANSIVTVPGDKTYVFFMPKDSKQQYAVDSKRLSVDEEAKSLGIELNQDTIHKGN